MRTPVPFNLINPFGLRSARGLDWGGSAEAEIAACQVFNFRARIEKEQEVKYWFEEQF
jgi:hypothetical protein